jgi:hypothetical protein
MPTAKTKAPAICRRAAKGRWVASACVYSTTTSFGDEVMVGESAVIFDDVGGGSSLA